MAKTVYIGNAAPTDPIKIDEDKTDVEKRPIPGGTRETVFSFPDDMKMSEILLNVAGSWRTHHSDKDPVWVESDDKALETLLVAEFDTEVGKPKGFPVAKSILRPVAGGSYEWDLLRRQVHVHDPEFDYMMGWMLRAERALRVDAGKDFQSRVMADTASNGTGSYAAANYMALTANATAPAAGDTTLTAEIATAGGGLLRAQAAYAHTAGASTYTLIKTFTANGSDALPVTVAKIGIFNASAAGTMAFETLLSATATLTVSGDQLQVTETVTI